MVSDNVVIVGIGEMGGVFARAFLRTGYSVHPVIRSTDWEAVYSSGFNPRLARVCVGEKDLHAVLGRLPTGWRDRVGLIQNELLPPDWQSQQLINPTVGSIWSRR